MIFSLAVYSAPYSSQASDSAYRFACAVLDGGHELRRVFFYQDGIYNANSFITAPQDERNLALSWQVLAEQHGVDLVVCVAAALRRGILNNEEAERYDKPGNNLTPQFQIGGLGQLLDAAVTSERVVTFGA